VLADHGKTEGRGALVVNIGAQSSRPLNERGRPFQFRALLHLSRWCFSRFSQRNTIKEPSMLSIQTILHPTDLSPRSEYALQLACSLARDHGARLIVLNVVQPPEEDKAIAWDALVKLQAPDPKVSMHRQQEVGHPAKEILRLAQELRCGLIVMGSHGRTGLSRVLMGSVAEEVSRKALCPVLTVKNPVAQAAS